MGGLVMAAKKMSCTVPSESEQFQKVLEDSRKRVIGMCIREFRALQKVPHANIVHLYGVVVDDPQSVSLLMELAPLGSLRIRSTGTWRRSTGAS